MKKYIIFWICFFLKPILTAAAEAHTIENPAWKACFDAAIKGDPEAFKASFSPELLKIHFAYNIGQFPRFRPANLAHVVALIKKQSSADILEHMFAQGLNPDEELTVYSTQLEILQDPDNNVTAASGFTGPVTALTVLDVAVAIGNVWAVKKLLEHGANPYRTRIYLQTTSFVSLLKIIAKEFFCVRCGENPYDHVLQYYKYDRESAGQTSNAMLSNLAREYLEIARELYWAQVNKDRHDIGRCDVL